MNKLSAEKCAQILNLLLEGNTLRTTRRIADVSFNTVTRLFVDAGTAFADYQNRTFRNLPCRRLQLDEIWCFVCATKHAADARAAPDGTGNVWTWVAIDAETKLVPSWRIGDRSGETASIFVADLAARLTNRVRITTNGHRLNLEAIEESFGPSVDYAMLMKLYGGASESSQGCYGPAECKSAVKLSIEEKRDPTHVSTSYAERQSLTMRVSFRRFPRLTNAFFEKIENHGFSVALHYMHYNFCRIHKMLRVTPAMAAGVTDKLWTIADMAAVLEAGS
jgi:IS1 family transposase